MARSIPTAARSEPIAFGVGTLGSSCLALVLVPTAPGSISGLGLCMGVLGSDKRLEIGLVLPHTDCVVELREDVEETWEFRICMACVVVMVTKEETVTVFIDLS